MSESTDEPSRATLVRQLMRHRTYFALKNAGLPVPEDMRQEVEEVSDYEAELARKSALLQRAKHVTYHVLKSHKLPVPPDLAIEVEDDLRKGQ